MLRDRIAAVGGNQALAEGGFHPAGTGATPMVMPGARVAWTPVEGYPAGTAPWGTASYEEMTGIWAADGAYIPAAMSGSWGQARAAGRPGTHGWVR